MKATKKEIRATLRTMNRTDIFRLVKKIYGEATRENVYNFVEANAPSDKVRDSAYRIAYGRRNTPSCYLGKHGFFEPSKLGETIRLLKTYCGDPGSPYSKIPVKGNNHLWFVSPTYRHADYNKSRICAIKGNERLCELLISFAKKHFGNYAEQ